MQFLRVVNVLQNMKALHARRGSVRMIARMLTSPILNSKVNASRHIQKAIAGAPMSQREEETIARSSSVSMTADSEGPAKTELVNARITTAVQTVVFTKFKCTWNNRSLSY